MRDILLLSQIASVLITGCCTTSDRESIYSGNYWHVCLPKKESLILILVTFPSLILFIGDSLLQSQMSSVPAIGYYTTSEGYKGFNCG